MLTYLRIKIRIRPIAHHSCTRRHHIFRPRGRDAAGIADGGVIRHVADVGCREGDGDR